MTEGERKQRTGKRGERKAARYLFFKGWKILEKNFRTPYGEIDVIAKRRGVLAFIEVKTRTTDKFGTPAEAVDDKRKRRYILGANYFLTNKIVDVTVRFDIIEVYRGKINHIENAFE